MWTELFWLWVHFSGGFFLSTVMKDPLHRAELRFTPEQTLKAQRGVEV